MGTTRTKDGAAWLNQRETPRWLDRSLRVVAIAILLVIGSLAVRVVVNMDSESREWAMPVSIDVLKHAEFLLGFGFLVYLALLLAASALIWIRRTHGISLFLATFLPVRAYTWLTHPAQSGESLPGRVGMFWLSLGVLAFAIGLQVWLLCRDRSHQQRPAG